MTLAARPATAGIVRQQPTASLKESEEAMPAKKATTKTPTEAEIDCANLDEIQKISNAVMRGVLGGVLTPKEGNEIRRRIGNRLQAIEEELRRGYRADSGRYEPHRRRRRSL
jgi:hypothetical protein